MQRNQLRLSPPVTTDDDLSFSSSSLGSMWNELSSATTTVDKAMALFSQRRRRPRKRESPRVDHKGKRDCHSKTNIVDFMNAVGEQTSDMNVSLVNKYANKHLLKLSAEWSNHLRSPQQQQRNKHGRKKHSVGIESLLSPPKPEDNGMDHRLTAASLSPECASREVQAISVLAQMESAQTPLSSKRHFWDEEDDDDATRELFLAETLVASKIQQELYEIDQQELSLRQLRTTHRASGRAASVSTSRRSRSLPSRLGQHIQSGREHMEQCAKKYAVPSRLI